MGVISCVTLYFSDFTDILNGKDRPHSPHYQSMSSLASHSSGHSPVSYSRLSLQSDALSCISSHIVAYHFCQADNNATCMVPNFVHSIAAYLCHAPQLAAYQELLLHEPHLQNVLSLRECERDASHAFIKGVLEPLANLKRAGKIRTDHCVIIVDSLNEAEFHKPDYGDTIASFIERHLDVFPPWLKLVVTVRSLLEEITGGWPVGRVDLDLVDTQDSLQRDLCEYITYRISCSNELRNNITLNGKLDPSTQFRFVSHLQSMSKGCFLYLKLTLDLVESGHLIMKSLSFKVLPVNLSEVFLLNFNLKFGSLRAFEKVSV